MANHQITHIRKLDRYSTHEHITHVKYDGEVHTREHVIRMIDSGADTFYVSRGGYSISVAVVRPMYPRQPFIRTVPDSTGVDNLLSLPEC